MWELKGKNGVVKETTVKWIERSDANISSICGWVNYILTILGAKDFFLVLIIAH